MARYDLIAYHIYLGRRLIVICTGVDVNYYESHGKVTIHHAALYL